MSKSLRKLIAEKVIKASNTNGLKQKVLDIINSDCLKRKFNKYEAINALNAIRRRNCLIKISEDTPPHPSFKYRLVRYINENPQDKKYKIELLVGYLIFYTYE